jgi:hypothetical protein
VRTDSTSCEPRTAGRIDRAVGCKRDLRLCSSGLTGARLEEIPDVETERDFGSISTEVTGHAPSPVLDHARTTALEVTS